MEEKRDYQLLFVSYKKMQLELEQANQALHECRIRSQAMMDLEQEYQEEIRILQVQGTEEVQQLKSKVRDLEETKGHAQEFFNKRLEYLESELVSKDEEIIHLKQPTWDVGDREQSSDGGTILNEILELKQENDDLRDKLEGLEKTLEKEIQQVAALEVANNQLRSEIDDYKEIVQCKKDELDETKTLVASVRDDYECLKAELDSLKSRPLDEGSKGNSLFAEVNDRRVELQKKYDMMKKKYLEMKSERSSLLKRATSASCDNITMINRWKKEVEQHRLDLDGVTASYKHQITTITELNELYRKKLDEKFVPIDSMEFYDSMMMQKNKEIYSINQKRSVDSQINTGLSINLAHANKKIRQLYLEKMELNEEKRQLEEKVLELEMAAVPKEKAVELEKEEVQLPKSIMKQTILKESDKENVEVEVTGDSAGLEEKKVKFTGATMEKQPESGVTVRRRCKILKTIPIKY